MRPGNDPTENVKALNAAEAKRQDDLRAAGEHLQNMLRQAETRRVDELAALRVYYDAIIEGMRTNSLKLLAEQLKENKADSSERTSKLEQFRWESGGKGIGVNAAAGWVLALITAGVAIAMYLKH